MARSLNLFVFSAVVLATSILHGEPVRILRVGDSITRLTTTNLA